MHSEFSTLARIFLISAFILSALYLITAYSIPEGLSDTEPRLALSLNPRYPTAAVAYADQAVTEEINRRQLQAKSKQQGTAPPQQQAADLGSIKKMLRAAILRDPINAKAFRLLGQIALLEEDVKTARRMMSISAKLSLEEATAVNFLMVQSVLANDAKQALYYADVLMRSSSEALLHSVAPLVARMMEVPAAKKELISTLGAGPRWRRYVFASLPGSGISDPRAPFEVLSALKNTPNPPTETEISGYIDLLLGNKLYALAYSTWLQFIPHDDMGAVAYLFNGSFERKPSGLQFDWTIGDSADIMAGVYARPDDPNKSALLIRFGQARAAFPTISEMIVLRPGAYHFKGSLTGEILARRGLQWRVTCVGGESLGESQMLLGRFPKWTGFEFDFSVPETCPAQSVALVHMARTPSEQLASGFVWFDDLAITRLGGVSAAQP